MIESKPIENLSDKCLSGSVLFFSQRQGQGPGPEHYGRHFQYFKQLYLGDFYIIQGVRKIVLIKTLILTYSLL